MVTTVEIPTDRVYAHASADITLDHGGAISIEFTNEEDLEPICLVYLGKDEIAKVLEICNNPDNIKKILDGAEREGRRKKPSIDMSRVVAEGEPEETEEAIIDPFNEMDENGTTKNP